MRAEPSLHSVYRRLHELDVREVSARDILRLFRGGALGREMNYLPAYLRIKSAFSSEQQLEELFQRGRLSCVSGSRILRLELMNDAK